MKTTIAFFCTLLLTFGFVTATLAADTAIVAGYEIEFVGAVNNATIPPTSTWTYAITANGDESGALSHWVLGLELTGCITVVSPIEAEETAAPWAYTTPTSDPYGYCGQPGVNCAVGHYEQVEYGFDPATAVDGIKFGDATNNGSQLEVDSTSDPALTHLFVIELSGVDATAQADVPVGIKAPGGAAGFVTGPTCAAPTAISLNNVSANNGAADWLPFLWLIVVTMLVPATYLLVRRQNAPVAV